MSDPNTVLRSKPRWDVYSKIFFVTMYRDIKLCHWSQQYKYTEIIGHGHGYGYSIDKSGLCD